MAKLTKKDRAKAIVDLTKRLQDAIEEFPRGLTNEEICHCIVAAVVTTGVVK